MATYHRQNSHPKKKLSISYEIRDEDERCHSSGVNSLQYDHYTDHLYTASRDSSIKIWDLSDEARERYQQKNRVDGSNHNYYNDIYCVRNKRKHINDYFVQSMDHHTDWVNDIALSSDGRHLLSVSNDTTMKVWNAQQGFCLSTLRSHKDYAKCLAHSKDKDLLASAGFDRIIYLWDIQVLTQLTSSKNTVTTKPLEGSKDSIYSLAINQNATLIASGSTERVIRLWDPRSRQKMLKFKGHTDNIRSLLFSNDGSLLISASSDSTVRVWSIPQQRCITIIRVHDRGVWTLQADEGFNTVFSGGKDGKVLMTNLKQPSQTSLVCKEQEPILRIFHLDKSYRNYSSDKGSTRSSLWVATSNSSIKNYTIRDFNDYNQEIDGDDHQSTASPDLTIKGNSSVIDYHVLNDKRHILSRESDNSLALYDVLTARKLETLHKCNTESETKDCLETEIKKRFKMIYVPNWFTVDLKTGVLCIHIEENDAFSAWVSARDYGFIPQSDGQDPKINLGRLTLQALFEHWPSTYDCVDSDHKNYYGNTSLERNQSVESCISGSSSTKNENNIDKIPPVGVTQRVGNQYFSIPLHTPIILSEGNQTIFKFKAYQASEQCEDMFLKGVVPAWISDIVTSKCQPKLVKIPFYLSPHPSSGIKYLRKERLTASDMLQMRKIIEHICEKILSERVSSVALDDVSSENQDHGSNIKGSHSSSKETNSRFERIELYCNDQKLDESLDLRSVKHYIWKTGGDIALYYLPIL